MRPQALRSLLNCVHFLIRETDNEGKPELSDARRSDCRAEDSERTIRDDNGTDFQFVSQKGGTLHRSQFFRAFQAIAESGGFPADKRHPHVLRHSLGEPPGRGNVNLALVKQALGFRAISSAMICVSTSPVQASESAAGVMMAMD
jgi:site-specific recombinase XerD